MKSRNLHIVHNIVAALIYSAAIFLYSCSGSAERTIETVDRTTWPTVTAENIETIVSDSGIVKFKINAPLYEAFDNAEEPYWEFKKGLKLQRYNTDKEVDSQIDCNYAKYFDKEQLWRLENKVFARNIDNETFETELLFWDQKKEILYTDQMVRITNDKEQIICYGFESNQNFTIYSFEKVQATFPVTVD